MRNFNLKSKFTQTKFEYVEIYSKILFIFFYQKTQRKVIFFSLQNCEKNMHLRILRKILYQ